MAQFTSLTDGSDDRSQLLHFIGYFLAVVEEIVQKNPSAADAVPPELLEQGLIPSDLESLFRDAWPVCREREVPLLTEGIRNVPFERLHRHGLVGSELKVKLATVSKISEWLWAAPTKRALMNLLGIIDSVLKSIFSAVHGGEALAELKEAIEKLISKE
jgi:hypothetical protein